MPARRSFPAAAVLLLAFAATTGLRAAVVEEIVAKINNRIITKSEFDERTQYLIQQTQQDAKGKDDFEAELQTQKDALLANLITEALLIERAETIFDFDKIRQNLIDDFRKQQNLADDTELEKALKEQNMTRKELEDHLLRLAVPNEIINYDVRRKISVSPAEMDAYFQEHRAQWETPATITFREILVTYDPERRDDALDHCKAVVTLARNGSDFIELVHKFSEAGSKEIDGLIGPVAARDLNPAIAQSIFALKPGDVSDPIDTGKAFDVVKIEAKAEATAKTLDDVKDDVYNAVREEKFRPRFDIYLKKLWKENYVEVVPKYQALLVVSPLKTTSAPAAAPPTGTKPGA